MDDLKSKIKNLIDKSPCGKEYSFANRDNKQEFIDAIKELIKEGCWIEFSSDYEKTFRFRKWVEDYNVITYRELWTLNEKNEFIYPQED